MIQLLSTTGGATSFFELDLTVEEDLKKFTKIKDIFNTYTNTSSKCCKKISSELIEDLVKEGYLDNEEVLSKRIVKEIIFRKKKDKIKIFGSEKFIPPPVEVIKEEDEVEGEVSEINVINHGFWKN